jgi:hypothetical protein
MAKSRRRSLRRRGKVADWFKQAAKDVGGFLKKHKILSRGGDFIKSLNILPPAWNAGLGAATGVAKHYGYGRSGRGVRLAGESMASVMSRGKSVHNTTRTKKFISRGLAMAMKSGLIPPQYAGALTQAHAISKSLGYGKRGGALRLAGSRKY